MMNRAFVWVLQLPVVVGVVMLWPVIDWVGLSPVATVVLLVAGVATALASFALTHRSAAVIPSAIFLGLVLLANFVDFTPVQPATRAIRRVRAGMSEAEVRAILRDEFPGSRRFHPPGLERPVTGDVLSFVLDPNDGDYDAAVIQVQFADDRAVSARFLPD